MTPTSLPERLEVDRAMLFDAAQKTQTPLATVYQSVGFTLAAEIAKRYNSHDELKAVCEAVSTHYSGSLDHQPGYVAMARKLLTRLEKGEK